MSATPLPHSPLSPVFRLPPGREPPPAPEAPPSQAKAERRRDALRWRSRQPAELAERSARWVARVGLNALAEARGASVEVTGYWPVRGELDARPLLAWLHKRGCRIGLPAVTEEKELEFRRWAPGGELQPGAFSIPVPPPENGVMARPDVLLVPLLAFDWHGYRLGYGGGFYDRALARLRREKPSARAYGLAFAEQELGRGVPREAHDQPLDGIFTQNGAIFRREKGARP